MEVASPREPWTAAVAWARPWHRPVFQVPQPKSPAGRGEAPERGRVDAIPAVSDELWRGALLHLESARERHADSIADLDYWATAMAQHTVHLAVKRVRDLAERLELIDGHLAGP